MSVKSIATGQPQFETSYASFPPDPEILRIGSHDVYEYLEPRQIDNIIKNLAEHINFESFDAVVVNMKGGRYLYERLKAENGYEGGYTAVEYHRPSDGVGTDTTISIPEELKGKKCLIIDDISDRGDTFMEMLKGVSPDSVCVALVSKKDIPNKKPVPNLLVGVIIDGHVWIGGCGMDIGYDGEGDIFRNHNGIVVKIPQKVMPDGTWIY